MSSPAAVHPDEGDTGVPGAEAQDSTLSTSGVGAPTPPSAPERSSRSTGEVTPLSTQVIAALNTWIYGLAGPQNPPFFRNAPFPDEEWTNLFQLLAVTTTLAAGSAVAGSISPNLFHSSLDSKSLSAVTGFGCFAVVYSLYARLFRIVISIRQSLFCFALVSTPWLPLYIVLKAAGWRLGIFWLPLLWLFALYVGVLIMRAIRIVSGASRVKVAGSLIFAFGLAISVVLTIHRYELGSSSTATNQPAASSPAPDATTPSAAR